MTDKEKERLKTTLREMYDCFIHEIIATAKQRVKINEDFEILLDLLDHVPGEVFIAIINNDKLADAIAEDCHDPGHDIRWCGTCETREAAIFDYRESIRKALNIKEEG